jgi:hypothetical protein
VGELGVRWWTAYPHVSREPEDSGAEQDPRHEWNFTPTGAPTLGRVRRCGGRVRRAGVLFTLLIMLYYCAVMQFADNCTPARSAN